MTRGPIRRGKRGITHVAPQEAQGIAKSPCFSTPHVGSGFRWGIEHVAANGVEDAPGVGPHTVLSDVPQNPFGKGFQKP